MRATNVTSLVSVNMKASLVCAACVQLRVSRVLNNAYENTDLLYAFMLGVEQA